MLYIAVQLTSVACSVIPLTSVRFQILFSVTEDDSHVVKL